MPMFASPREAFKGIIEAGAIAVVGSHGVDADRILPPQSDAACGGSIAAAQQFALYLTVSGVEFVALHFDDFRCSNKSVHCGTTGCLHEVYVANKGRYHRVLTVQARDIRLLRDQNAAVVEISGVNGEVRALRWNGRRFVER